MIEPSTDPTEGEDLSVDGAAKRTHRRGLAALGTAFILVAATVSFFFLRSSNDNALALSFSSGQTIRYHLTIAMNADLSIGSHRAPMVATTSADAEWHVMSVDSAGTATIQMSISNGTVTSKGTTQTLPPQQSTFQLTADGRMLSSSGATLFSGGPARGALGDTDQLSALLPQNGNAKPGDSWTKQISQTLFGAPLTFTEHGSYLRDEQIGSIHAAVIEARGTIPMNFTVNLSDLAGLFGSGTSPSTIPPDATMKYSGQAVVDTTSWIDVAAKQILKTTGVGRFSISVVVNGAAAAGMPPVTSLTMSGTYKTTLERM